MPWRGGPPRRESSGGVLLVSAGGLGDTVLLAQVVERFSALARPGELISILLRQDAAQMAFLFPDAMPVVTVDISRLRDSRSYRRELIRNLYDAHYRLVVSVDHLRHPHLDEALIKGCRASETVAMEPRSWPKYDNRLAKNRANYDRLFDSGPDHVDKVIRWSRFADWLCGTDRPPPPIGLSAIKPSESVSSGSPEVIFIPFSAVKEKQSPVSLYRQLIEILPNGYQAVIAGAPADLDRNPDFRDLVSQSDLIYDDSTFPVLAPRLRRAKAVVAVDTAGMHLAVAMGVPTLCLASAAYVGEIVPYADEIRPDNVDFIFTPLQCQGCLGRCIYPAEQGMYPCVAQLDEAEIVQRLRALLQKDGRR